MASNVVPNTLTEPDLAEPQGPKIPAWERYLGWLYLVVLIITVAGLTWLPMQAGAYTVTLWLTVLMMITMATSWNMLSGFGGYTSFGHAAFFGIGSYVGALLLHYEKTGWVAAVVLSGVATGLIALAIGLPTLRLRGPYFAIAMLAFTELVRVIVLAWDDLTFGGNGVYLPIVRFQRPGENETRWDEFLRNLHDNQNYYAMMILAIVAVIATYIIGTSRLGLKLLSIRDDEIAAQAMGIRTTRIKILTFGFSAIFPGIAGAIYARQVGYIDPVTVFAVIWSIRSIATTILGGQGTILGPIIGAVLLTLISERVWETDPNLYQVIFGGLIVLVVLFMPGGIIALLRQWHILPRSRRL